VAHPVLHGPYIEPPAQHSRGIGGTKRLQIKLCRIEFGALPALCRMVLDPKP
jgi:hypothetical protein